MRYPKSPGRTLSLRGRTVPLRGALPAKSHLSRPKRPVISTLNDLNWIKPETPIHSIRIASRRGPNAILKSTRLPKRGPQAAPSQPVWQPWEARQPFEKEPEELQERCTEKRQVGFKALTMNWEMENSSTGSSVSTTASVCMGKSANWSPYGQDGSRIGKAQTTKLNCKLSKLFLVSNPFRKTMGITEHKNN